MSKKLGLPEMLTFDFDTPSAFERLIAFSIGEEKSRACTARLLDRYGSVATIFSETEEEICRNKSNEYKTWNENGYAVVFQHCRGRGKSSGDCIPYINEREDGLSLQDWIRNQPFYNG